MGKKKTNRDNTGPVSTENTGAADLADACDAFLAWQRDSGRAPLRRAERRRQHLLRLVTARLLDAAQGQRLGPALHEQLQALSDGRCTPDEAAEHVVDALCAAWKAAPPR